MDVNDGCMLMITLHIKSKETVEHILTPQHNARNVITNAPGRGLRIIVNVLIRRTHKDGDAYDKNLLLHTAGSVRAVVRDKKNF